MTQKRSDAAAEEPSTKTPFDVIKEAGATIGTNKQGRSRNGACSGGECLEEGPRCCFSSFLRMF